MGKRFTALNGAALAVGAFAGLAAVGLRDLIHLVEDLSFRTPSYLRGVGAGGEPILSPRESNQFIVSDWGALVILVPLVGGLLVGLIRQFWPGTRQYGVTEVMAAVQAKGGILRGRSSIGHAAVSAITVGTGGSTGREGPISYIGAAIGSSLGRQFGFTARDIKILLGCGFSAGIATSFNAPMGGVLMALELVLPEFSTHAFIPLVLSTVTGVAVGRIFLADQATFQIAAFHFGSTLELPVYLLLGIVCGLFAVAFIRLVSWTYRAWHDWRMPEVLKPALGGLLVGILGYVLVLTMPDHHYHVFGTGYSTVTSILQAPASSFGRLVPLLLVLVIAKPVATSLTVGSGGGGGMFSVSLYQGALWGGLIGWGAAAVWPHVLPNAPALDPASFALIGMAAFYAAASRATLTAIVITAELSQSFAALLPTMVAAVVADAVCVRLSRDSLYTLKLASSGIRYEHDRVQSPLDFLAVKDVMSKQVDTLPATTTVGEAFNRMLDLGHTGYPVVDEHGKLAGIVTRRDLSRHLQAGKGSDPLSAVVPGLTITAFPDEMLYRARDRIHKQGIGRLVVVDPKDRRTIVGILTRSDLLRAEAEKDVGHGEDWTATGAT